MGQAKKRGSFEERLKKALSSKIKPIHAESEYLSLIRDEKNLKVPRIIDINVENFCNELRGAEPLYVRVVPEEYSQRDNCDLNVKNKIALDGGELKFGYKIWYLESAYLIAERHAVWFKNGEYLDITYDNELNNRILFVPDLEKGTNLESKLPRIDKALLKNLENIAKNSNHNARTRWEIQKQQSQGILPVQRTLTFKEFTSEQSYRYKPLLEDMIPLKEVKEKLGSDHFYEIHVETNLNKIIKNSPNTLFLLASNAWHNYCEKNNLPNDQRVLGEVFSVENHYLFNDIERRIGQRIFDEILLSEVTISGSSDPIITLELSAKYNEELLIMDVSFQNIFKPKSRFEFQQFEGLNMFGALLEKLKTYCEEYKIPRITLQAVNVELVDFFEKFDFVIEDSELAKRAYKEWGYSIPMHLKMN